MHTEGLLVAVLLLLVPFIGVAQTTLDSFVLIPVYTTPLAGGYGSLWESHLTVRNDADSVVFVSLPPCVLCAGDLPLQPHRDTDIAARQTHTFGRIIRMPAAQADQLRFNARVEDLSRQKDSAGVEIPVVRQKDLRARLVLLNVPVDARFRNALRIFDTSGIPTNVRLRIFALDTNEPLVDTSIALTEPTFTADNAFPAQSNLVDLGGTFPAITGATSLRIEIDGTTPMLWAMVSTTNNETQEVTIVTPN